MRTRIAESIALDAPDEDVSVETGYDDNRILLDFRQTNDSGWWGDRPADTLGAIVSIRNGSDTKAMTVNDDAVIDPGQFDDEISVVHPMSTQTGQGSGWWSYVYETTTPTGESDINTWRGNDSISITGALAVSVKAGKGDDTVEVEFGVSTYRYDEPGMGYRSTDYVGSGEISLGRGNDSATIVNANDITISGNRGDDIIEIVHGISTYDESSWWGSSSSQWNVGHSTVYGGAGDDRLSVSNAKESIMTGGSGADTFSIAVSNGGDGSTYTVTDLSDIDTLEFRSSGEYDLATLDQIAAVSETEDDVLIQFDSGSSPITTIVLEGVADSGDYGSLADVDGVYDLSFL